MSDTNKQNSEKVTEQDKFEKVDYSENPELRYKTRQKVRDAILNGKERDNYFYLGFDVEENPYDSSNIKADLIIGFDQNYTVDLVHLIVKAAQDMGFAERLFYELIKQP